MNEELTRYVEACREYAVLPAGDYLSKKQKINEINRLEGKIRKKHGRQTNNLLTELSAKAIK